MYALGQQLTDADKQRMLLWYFEGYRQVIKSGRKLIGKEGERYDQARAKRNELWARLLEAEPHINQAITNARWRGEWQQDWPQSALEIRQRISQEEQQGMGAGPVIIPLIGLAILAGALALAFWPLVASIAKLIGEINTLLVSTWPLPLVIAAAVIGWYMLREHKRGTFRRSNTPGRERDWGYS